MLVAVAEGGSNGASLSEAARRARVHPATAHRLLHALVRADFISLDPYRKRYTLGLMAYEVVARAGENLVFLDLRHRMRRALKAVQADLGGIVCLSVPSNGEALCIDLIAGDCEITVNTLEVGSRRPLGAGAASLALLASLPAEEREATVLREQERYLKYGDLTAGIVREACAGLATKGYVVNEGVIIPDILALAVPIFEGRKLVAAISVTNTVSQFSEPRRAEMHRMMMAVVRSAGFSAAPEA